MKKIIPILLLALAACLPMRAQTFGTAYFYGNSPTSGPGTGSTTNQVAKGIPANASGTATALDSIVCTPPIVNGQYTVGYTVTASAAVAPTCPLVGLVPDALAGATVLYSDNNNIIYNPPSALSLPTPTTLANPNFYTVVATPAGTAVTLTPVTWTVSLNGATAGATAAIPAHAQCAILIDQVASTQWDVNCVAIGIPTAIPIGNVGSAGLSGTSPITISAAGAIGCATCSVSTGLGTATNCTSSASPAVCGSAQGGSVVVAAGATTVVVNTSAVTANSQILLQYDSSLGTKLSVTCNVIAASLAVTARTAATSFTATISAAPITNPLCISYAVVN